MRASQAREGSERKSCDTGVTTVGGAGDGESEKAHRPLACSLRSCLDSIAPPSSAVSRHDPYRLALRIPLVPTTQEVMHA